ncbi:MULTISPECIES: phage tail tape measure protein [Providencia]|uniref:Phage tail tape measure protein n=2 Tax=Providencia TaxID=586 RepID=A0AA42FJY0_9GAMM|nr:MULTISPECIES: phage tail tape measure protein [Providencia]MDG4695677.1 phage tail tape measure protein [Providencia sp. CRE-3FA-0001]MDT0133122.1 phage tail tape measure protein [Providencia huaxiensis]MDT1979528.1 phage tail tape measure protein [Providencia huaxiensis]
MSQQIADLEIKIGANTTEFFEKSGRVERELEKKARDDIRFAKIVQNARDVIDKRNSEKLRNQSNQTKLLENEAMSAKQRALESLRVLQKETAKFSSLHIKTITELERKNSEAFTFLPDLTEQYSAQLNHLERQKASLNEIIALRHRIDKSFKDGALTRDDNTALQSRAIGISRELEQAENSATQAKQRFINKLKEQVIQQNLSRTEMLRLKAAQLGVSSSADIYIRKLEKQNSVMKGVTLTSGQYRQAMRQLPMQMTDIVTSLASGMPPWLVAVQQGGQIKDSFGGFGNSLKAITSLITPWKVAMFGGAGALTAFGVAAYQGSKELTEYNKQLILTGNYAAKTQGQLNALAKSLSGDGITQYKMADALAQVVGSGSFAGAQVDMVAGVAAKMEKATGQSIDETIKQFQRLKDQPVQAVMELDKSLHFLTATQLEQITTLEEQGRTSEATKLSMELYSSSLNERTKQISENLGTLETAWKWVGEAAQNAWDRMLNVGRSVSVQDKLDAKVQQLVAARKELEIAEKGGAPDTTGYGIGRNSESFLNQNATRNLEANKTLVKNLTLEVENLQNQISNEKSFNAGANAISAFNEKMKKQFEADLALKKKYETSEEKHQSELKRIRNDEHASQSAKELAIQRENERYKKELARKTPKGKAYKPDIGTRYDESSQAELTALQAQLRLLQQHQTATDFISQQRKNFQLEQAKFDVLEEASKSRKLSLDEQSLLKNKEGILANKMKLADLGDQISKQEHLNKLQDQADKYVKQQEARQKAITDSLGKSSLELQRALEIEQLRSTYGNTPQWEKVEGAKLSTFAQEDTAKQDWMAGMKTAWGDYRDAALDANAQIQSVTSATLNGFSSTLSSVLVDGQANFKDFTKSILKMLAEIAIKMSIVKGFEAFGFGGVTANAKGGVYNSPGLSAYSGQIVSQPTLFPFARGAGLMGEAGPEAILPLRRGIDGKLGVVAASGRSGGEINQTFQINIQNEAGNGEIGPNAVKEILNLVEQKTRQVMTKERRDGGSFSA